MKSVIRIGLCVLIAGCLLSFAGCKKKADEAKPVAPAEANKPVAEMTTEAAKTTTLPAAAGDTIPLTDVKAEAAKMNVEQLKARAMEYKDLIEENKASIETITAKLKGIPLAEQMGAEAKELQADLVMLNKSVAALTERFQVYYNKLKEMGADVSSLTI